MNSRHHMRGIEQEPEGLKGRLIGWVIGVTTAVTIACPLLVGAMLRGERQALAGAYEPPAYPVSPTVGGLEQLRMEGRAHGLDEVRRGRRALDEYGWVDRPHGIAKIPIDRAMSWVVEDAARGKLGHEIGPDGGRAEPSP